MVQDRIERLPNLLDAISKQGQQFALMTPKGRKERTPISMATSRRARPRWQRSPRELAGEGKKARKLTAK